MKISWIILISEKKVSNLFRQIPKVDTFVEQNEFTGFNKKLLIQIARKKINALREKIANSKIDYFDMNKLMESTKKSYYDILSSSLKPLINATGVILHTNMGRSLISKDILDNASKVICNYSNLEYDVKKGTRGERYAHAQKGLKELLGVEDVLVVNNNASAVFLILNSFAKNKEVIVSRGELVEIGGSFRIPEVMKESGAILKEVGTTNKTKPNDYGNAINNNTSMLMKVHKSNFSIEGFSEETDFSTIKKIALNNNLLDYYDLGSGYIPRLPYNLGNNEHSLSNILKSNPSLISFSGDKLFGSVQAGIIVGKKELIKRLKKNQLLRMLRVDKITLSILEESVKAYLQQNYEQIPTLKLLFQDINSLQKRAEKLQKSLGKDICEVISSTTFMGGGTLPNRKFPTIALHIKGKAIELEKKFRKKYLIGRIEQNKFLIDFRSIMPSIDDNIEQIIKEVLT